MALETLTGTVYLNALVSTNPTSTDNKSEGDDHIRGIKNVLLNSFPGVTGAVTATHTELNKLDGVTASTTELNILDGVTATAAELNVLDGITATVSELNILDGVTATAAEINLLDGVTGPLKGAFRGALVYKSATQSIPNNTLTALTFDLESYDTDSIHDAVTNTSRLTVPSGITRVRLTGDVMFASGSSTAGARSAAIYKNGGSALGLPINSLYDQFEGISLISAVVTVVAGDYFELITRQATGGALNATTQCWFAMEIIE